MFDLFGNPVTTNRCQVTLENGSLVFRSPYIANLVEAIKSLPYSERRWDSIRRVWIIDPAHGRQLVDWIELYANETISLPAPPHSVMSGTMRLLEVRYIGACKMRDDGNSSAFGLVGSDWSMIFPEYVLRAWFEGDFELTETPSAGQTQYQVLGIKKNATKDEIKTAYRRMVKQWHPDICREPNANEIFIRIQEAYQLLSNTNSRARYDAGLVLQAAFEKRNKNIGIDVPRPAGGTYRSPLRCGLIMVEGTEKVGRLEVAKILEWRDIVRNGKTLVVSWPMGAKEPVEKWI